MEDPNTQGYLEETIKVMRPTQKNQIFNEVDWDVIITKDADGSKLVILRPKHGK
jgi:hypothetical protein